MHLPRNGSRRGGRRLTALAARWQIAAALLLVGLAALFATTASGGLPRLSPVKTGDRRCTFPAMSAGETGP